MMMVAAEPDVLESLLAALAARQRADDSLITVVRRILVNNTKASQAEAPNQASPSGTSLDGQKVHYQLLGEVRAAPNAATATIDILATLASLDPSFLGQLAPKVRGSSRNHLARSPEQVYPRRPDLAHLTKSIVPGWYIGTNIANREKLRILRAACTVTRLTFGIDLKVDFAE